ncbi:MAG: D-aminoacylase [Gemmatimonadaceae bacterium]|nr:D-aminoacylase [Gemmatimonadaceae bacterium]NUQ92360.1 D-aminoacylase [Gemmatimonadaceae bacterium]NUS98562.1 D-aminoacylase [Gemmatimonadaceae bacterium]
MSTTRRGFVAGAGAAIAAAACGPFLHLGRHEHDVVVRGGTVFDGSGADGRDADVAIRHGVVTVVEPRVTGSGRVEIDARGRAVAPGFVDIHSHGDGTLFADPRAESVIRQGITTIVVGQDGASRAPAPRPTTAAGLVRGALGTDGRSESMHELFRAINRLPSAVNVASMIGLGTVRALVVGEDDRPATADELSRMRALVEGALAEGACGVSTGLEYAPGSFASREEIAALCAPLAARGLPYATHMRNEDDRLLEAIDEALAIARAARCPLQISHLKTQGPRNWAKVGDALGRIEAAKAAGMDVAFDRYPYVAYATGLSNLFPNWSLDGGTDAFLARLDAADTAPRIRRETLAKVEGLAGWNSVMIAGVADAADKAAEGRKLGDYAATLGADPYDTAVALLRRNRADVDTVVFAMSEDNLKRILAHPLGMVCSDGGAFAIEGPARRGHPHPRGLGTFPRVLARYVRETKTLTLAQAVHKMSGFAASRLGLTDRGRLAAGMAGDVVVFDPATVEDRATFAQPFQYPVGIDVVIVNGRVALRDGQRADARNGRALRAGAASTASLS